MRERVRVRVRVREEERGSEREREGVSAREGERRTRLIPGHTAQPALSA